MKIIEHSISGINRYTDDPSEFDVVHLATYRQTNSTIDGVYERIREQQSSDSTEWVFVDQFRRGEHSRGIFEEKDGRFVVFNDAEQIVMKGYGGIDAPDYADSWTLDSKGLLTTWEAITPENITTRSYIHRCE